MVTLEIMEKIDAFKGLEKAQLEKIQVYCEIFNFKKGECLFTEGEDAIDLWFLLEGEIGMRFKLPGRSATKENTVASISRYNAFGWSCFIPPNKYKLSAYCSSESCKTIKIKKAKLEGLFKKDTDMGYAFMTFLINDIGLRYQQYENEVAKLRGEEIISGW